MALDNRKTILKIGSGTTRGGGNLVSKTSLLGVRTSTPSSNPLPPVAPSNSKSAPPIEPNNTAASTYFEVVNGSSYFLDGYYES